MNRVVIYYTDINMKINSVHVAHTNHGTARQPDSQTARKRDNDTLIGLSYDICPVDLDL